MERRVNGKIQSSHLLYVEAKNSLQSGRIQEYSVRRHHTEPHTGEGRRRRVYRILSLVFLFSAILSRYTLIRVFVVVAVLAKALLGRVVSVVRGRAAVHRHHLYFVLPALVSQRL